MERVGGQMDRYSFSPCISLSFCVLPFSPLPISTPSSFCIYSHFSIFYLFYASLFLFCPIFPIPCPYSPSFPFSLFHISFSLFTPTLFLLSALVNASGTTPSFTHLTLILLPPLATSSFLLFLLSFSSYRLLPFISSLFFSTLSLPFPSHSLLPLFSLSCYSPS